MIKTRLIRRFDDLGRIVVPKEVDHIKNLSCLCVHMEYKTKNLEVRWCDDYKERMERAIEMCEDFYDSDGNYIGKYDPECMPLELRKVN